MEYGTRPKRVDKLCINLSTKYGLVLGKRTDYLQSWLEGKKKWETTSNDRDLLKLLEALSPCCTNMKRTLSTTM